MTNVPSGAGAVMASRHEPHDSLDFFPTPPWSTRALCEYVIGINWTDYTAWDPACGDGAMVRPLKDYFNLVLASDVHDYGWGHTTHDFLQPFLPRNWVEKNDFLIFNPPFRLAEQFIRRSLDLATVGVAVLVRTAFLEGCGRHKNLFLPRPPAIIAQFAERVPMVKGRLDQKATTATAYCWVVWRKNTKSTEFMWIPPCRAKFERSSDYLEPPR